MLQTKYTDQNSEILSSDGTIREDDSATSFLTIGHGTQNVTDQISKQLEQVQPQTEDSIREVSSSSSSLTVGNGTQDVLDRISQQLEQTQPQSDDSWPLRNDASNFSMRVRGAPTPDNTEATNTKTQASSEDVPSKDLEVRDVDDGDLVRSGQQEAVSTCRHSLVLNRIQIPKCYLAILARSPRNSGP